MGKLSRKKRIRREAGIVRDRKPKLGRRSHYADACGCGAAIERGAKMCRYCAMKVTNRNQTDAA